MQGEFDRGDVLLICDEADEVLGCGRAQYDRTEADEALGKHGQRPLIHYDYLYLSNRGAQDHG
jgi:glutamate 5-kinase